MAAEDERLGIPATVPIYHGIDLERFQYTEAARSDRFIFVGRVAPHKGVKEAIDLAKKAGVKLDIIGKVNKSDQPYWAALSDEVDGKAIRYLGALPQAEVVRHLQTARALLFPSQQLEAFGQTIVEAQACGTPVITSDLGGARELVVPGKTGFIASNTADYINAIGAVGALDPLSCRKQAERFDVRTMLGEYHKLYSLLGR
jgi:glycosyltransferase involved in cell wall biosynthesis